MSPYTIASLSLQHALAINSLLSDLDAAAVCLTHFLPESKVWLMIARILPHTCTVGNDKK